MRTFDLAVLLAYMLGVFGLGCWFSKKSSNTQEFMAAGRSLPGWAVGLSIFGTYVSSIGFLGNAGKAFGGNWNFWVFGLSLPIAAVFAVKYFIPQYRSTDSVSAYSHLETRFGPWARVYALLCYLLAQLSRIGTMLYLVALALAPLTGWDIRVIILVTGVLVTVYTLLGGIEAVIWTDVAQSVVLILGTVLCVVLLLWEMPGGARELINMANANDKFSLGSFDASPGSLVQDAPSFWMVLVYGIFINIQNFGIDQSFVQRYITAKTDGDASRSVIMASVMFPVISILFFFIGTGLFSLYHSETALLDEVKTQVATEKLIQDNVDPTDKAVAEKAATLKDTDIQDKVLPHFIVRKLPSGLAGLLIAAIFAAAMSSMDTSLNSGATLVLTDVYQRLIRPDAGEKESMRVLYGSTLVLGIVGTLTALAMIRVKSALELWWDLQGIFTGGMLGLFLLGMISRRARNSHAVTSVVAGILLILWLSLSKTKIWPEAWAAWANPFQSLMTIVFGTSSIVLIGVLLTSLFSPGQPPQSSPAGPQQSEN
ncbi:MAG: sodium:solute symporter [Planctomycetaceae bacterium]|nr:sodium:solute symporter [Planctomycetaceae bacterium]